MPVPQATGIVPTMDQGSMKTSRTVDSQVRDAEDRAFDLDEAALVLTVLADDDAACERQITIEPRVPEPAAVSLDADLEVAGLGPLRDRPNAQVRAVDVRRHDRHTRTGLPGRR